MRGDSLNCKIIVKQGKTHKRNNYRNEVKHYATIGITI